MSIFTPVTSLADLRSLNEAEVMLGYMSGFEGEPEPGVEQGRSFAHGWRNGMIDSERMAPEECDRLLATALHVLA